MKKITDFVSEASLDISIRSQTPHYYLGSHIRYYFYFHVIGTAIVNVCGIALSVVALLHPWLHRESPVYSQIFHHYERLHVHSYYFWYHVVVIFFLCDFSLQIVTSGVGIFGAKLRNPMMLWPHLAVLLVHVGVIIVLFIGFVCVNFLLDRWVLVLPLIVGAFALSAALDLAISVACYRYVRERAALMKVYSASTKTVHFQQKKKRNRHGN